MRHAAVQVWVGTKLATEREAKRTTKVRAKTLRQKMAEVEEAHRTVEGTSWS